VGKEGIKSILEQLLNGRAVVVFPEGERTHDGNMQAFKPGISLLIKRARAPIIPIGIAGAYQAWPRWRKLPLPAPLFLPACERHLAVVAGQPLDARHYADMPRDQMMEELFHEVAQARQQAEKLRRKP